jgi:hypothetical protein
MITSLGDSSVPIRVRFITLAGERSSVQPWFLAIAPPRTRTTLEMAIG